MDTTFIEDAAEILSPRQINARRGSDEVVPRPDLPNVFLMIDSFQTGGSERQFAALAQSLDPEKFNLNLGCIQRRGPFMEALGKVPQFSFGGSAYGWKSIATRWRLRRHLRTRKIAIAHAFDFYTNLALIPAALMAGTVVIGSHRQLGDLLSPLQFWAQLAMFRWCDAVVCNSHAAAEVLIKRGLKKDRIAVIANGLPLSCFAQSKPALPAIAGLMRVGMIARMNSTAKNHRIFLKAAARLRDQFSNVQFVLIGDGSLRKTLEQEASELGLGDRISFLGDRQDIPSVFASLDVSVNPSESESLSNAIIESMAAGVPVVASNVGGNSELITAERGILVARGDETEVVSAIARLLKDGSLRSRLSTNARQFARDNFTIDRMQRRHEELYSNLLERKRWRHSPRTLILPVPKGQPEKIRVSIVAASLQYVGGQSVQADLLLRELRDDPDVHAELIPIDPKFPVGLQWVNRIPVLRTLVRQPLYLAALRHGLKAADVAHIFSASYWSFLIAPAPAVLMARWMNKKVIIHYHSGEARDHLRRFRSAIPVLKRADSIVVPSEHLAEVFGEFALTTKVIPNIVDTSQFTFRARSPIRPHLVCTRGFHPYYGVDVVVQAFAEVQRMFPEAQLDLVGGGPLEKEIRESVKKLGLSRVNFAGVAARYRIADFYHRADIFINASRLDNMPVSVLEAFASGTPVVSTAPEGMKYLIDHERTGLLSPPDDPGALAKNVIRILNDPTLASNLALNAREELKRYSWGAVRKHWFDLYASLKKPDGSSKSE